MNDWVWFSENNFVLEGLESKKIDITVTVPSNASYGNYTGTMATVFKRKII